MEGNQRTTVEGIIHLKGATCTSCVIGIEHMGKRLEGVQSIHVEKADNTIHLNYDGTKATLDKICDFVHRIGYEAHYREEENSFTA